MAHRLQTFYKPRGSSSIHHPPCYKDLHNRMGKSPVMLIRHAKSLSNIGGGRLHKEAETSEKGLPLEKWLSVFGDEKLIDSKLCEEGIE